MRQPVVIIGGAPRSGTTLMRNIVGAHHATYAVPSDWVIFDKPGFLRAYSGVQTVETYEDACRAVERLLTHDIVRKWDVATSDVQATLAKRSEWSWKEIFLAMVETLEAAHPGCQVVLKTPLAERYFVWLNHLFRKEERATKFIYCVRSPLDAYRSWRHRSFAWKNDATVDNSPHPWAAMWMESTGLAVEFAAMAPDQLKIVHFEQLVSEPVRVARGICQFLGLEDMAQEMVSGVERPANSSFSNTNEVLERKGGVVVMTQRTAKALERWEHETLQRVCSRRARAFGYDLGGVNCGADVERYRYDEQEVVIYQLPTSKLLRTVARVLAARLGSRARHLIPGRQIETSGGHSHGV